MKISHLLNCLVTAWLVVGAGAASADNEFAPMAARYQETRSDGHTAPRSFEWYFTRNGNQVEIGRGAYVELWDRDARGELTWQRIFHDDRKLVVYAPGDVLAMGRALPWETLNTIVDFRKLKAELHPAGKIEHLGRPAIRYTGRRGNLEIELVWLEAEQLPARVVHRDQAHTYYQLLLQELHPEPQSGWPRSDLAKTRDYEVMSGVDLGDREYDPFVRKVLSMDGHIHIH